MAGTNLTGSSWLVLDTVLFLVAGVEVGVAESDMSELDMVAMSDTGEKGKLEFGLRILRDLVVRGEKWNGLERLFLCWTIAEACLLLSSSKLSDNILL